MADSTRYSVLANADYMICPQDGLCPICKVELRRGKQVAYLSGGALLLTRDRQTGIQTNRLEAFLHVGVHGSDPDMKGSADISVVSDFAGGQYDIQWCSVKCMRQWWSNLFLELERRVHGSEIDTRSLARISRDERIAAEPHLPIPEIPSETVPLPLESILPKRPDRKIQ
jgi:hypothetical protein